MGEKKANTVENTVAYHILPWKIEQTMGNPCLFFIGMYLFLTGNFQFFVVLTFEYGFKGTSSVFVLSVFLSRVSIARGFRYVLVTGVFLWKPAHACKVQEGNHLELFHAVFTTQEELSSSNILLDLDLPSRSLEKHNPYRKKAFLVRQHINKSPGWSQHQRQLASSTKVQALAPAA